MNEENQSSLSQGQQRLDKFLGLVSKPRKHVEKQTPTPISKKTDSDESNQELPMNMKEYKKITQFLVVKNQKKLEQPILDEPAPDVEHQRLFKIKTQQMLAEALKQNEDYRREKARNSLERGKQRLGEFVSKTSHLTFMEEWEDGSEIKKVKQLLKSNQEQMQELQTQKSELKQKKSNGAGEDPDITSIKLRIEFQMSLLEKHEKDIKAQLQKLDDEKQIIIQQTRRFQEEQQYFINLIRCQFARCIPPWPVVGKRYQMLALLGKGGFSEVYKAFDLEEVQLRACKIHALNSHWNEAAKSNYIKHAVRENEIHRQLKHRNIVQVFETVDIDNESFCTVLELCDGGDLSFHLKKYKTLNEKESKLIIRQVLSALEYMNGSSQQIIHYDLKPQNILFHKGEVKITDFGLCKVLDSDVTRMELTSQGQGTFWYLPPECFIEHRGTQINSKVDIWSVGVILYEMLFGKRPFGDGMSQEQIINQGIMLKSINIIFPQNISISQDCKEFIIKCLTYNMEARWSVQEAILSHFITKN